MRDCKGRLRIDELVVRAKRKKQVVVVLVASSNKPQVFKYRTYLEHQQHHQQQQQPVAVVNLLLFLLIPFLLSISHFRTVECIQVASRHTIASIPGDLVIGALVPVHERPSPKQAQTRTCGSVREQYGIQRVEAAFRTIDSINADPNILPNITLGIEIRDSCWHSPIALEQSIEFIRNAMAAGDIAPPSSRSNVPPLTNPIPASNELNVMSSNASSTSAQVCVAPLLTRQQQPRRLKNIVGVVGPASSQDTVQVQNLLQLFNMPQVGYSATSRDLSNKNFYKYFLRVVPSDKLQAQVMIDLMLAHNWTYITVAYTEGSYGSSLMNAFRERAQEVGICFATLESMPPNADDTKFDELIEAIQKHPNARVVICMCEGRTVSRLFSGFKRFNITNEYLVVGSDGWSDRFDVVEYQEEFALGGISIRIHSAYVNDFDDYYFSLSPYTNTRNPWFAEFWETRFQCNLELNATSSTGSGLSSQAQQLSPSLSRPPGSARASGPKLYNRTCSGRESLRKNHKQDAKMAFVQKSIITMALGLDSLQRATCPSREVGLCPEMLPLNGSQLLQQLMNVSFSFLGEQVYFDEQGDPPGKYEILNFQRRRPRSAHHHRLSTAQPDYSTASLNVPFAGDDNSVADLINSGQSREETGGLDEGDETEVRRRLSPHYDSYSTLHVLNRPLSSPSSPSGSSSRPVRSAHLQAAPASGYSSTSAGYEYVHVGSWKSSDGLSLFGKLRWPGAGLNPSVDGPDGPLPRSVCSLPCAPGHAKRIQSDSVKCCWVCVPCRAHEYLADQFNCSACEKGWWPNSSQTGCYQIPIQYLDWRSMEAIAALSIALFGLMLTLATGIVFIRHNDTPVVKSTTRELSYMILIAMLLCYANTFFLVAKPSQITCFLTRILPGFSFAMMYGALVTKTNRIARILAGSKKKIITRRPLFMSATAQVAISWLIVLLECVIIIAMLIQEPPGITHDYPSEARVVLVCNTTTLGILAPLGFDFFLIAMCTWYAFKTRNVPENFNEAKFIGFTMYTTLVIWIAFVAIYLSSDHKVTTLCLCISFSSLFALFLLFFPRCYIILLKPEKNNRSYFTTTKNVRCHIGYQLGSAGAAAAAAAAAHLQSPHQQPAVASSLVATITTTSNSLDSEQQQQQHQQHTFGQSAGSSTRSRPMTATSVNSSWPLVRHSTVSGRSDSLPGRAPPESEWGVGQSGSLGTSLLAGVCAAFGRRSRRKQSDRVSSIQQHLRAIRHAENLDRQTNFRRSQVQRALQRFETAGGIIRKQVAQSQKLQASSPAIVNASHITHSNTDDYMTPDKIERERNGRRRLDELRLLELLSQLLEPEEMRNLMKKLVDVSSSSKSGKSNAAALAASLVQLLRTSVQESATMTDINKLTLATSHPSVSSITFPSSNGSVLCKSTAREDELPLVPSQSGSCEEGNNNNNNSSSSSSSSSNNNNNNNTGLQKETLDNTASRLINGETLSPSYEILPRCQNVERKTAQLKAVNDLSDPTCILNACKLLYSEKERNSADLTTNDNLSTRHLDQGSSHVKQKASDEYPTEENLMLALNFRESTNQRNSSIGHQERQVEEEDPIKRALNCIMGVHSNTETSSVHRVPTDGARGPKIKSTDHWQNMHVHPSGARVMQSSSHSHALKHKTGSSSLLPVKRSSSSTNDAITSIRPTINKELVERLSPHADDTERAVNDEQEKSHHSLGDSKCGQSLIKELKEEDTVGTQEEVALAQGNQHRHQHRTHHSHHKHHHRHHHRRYCCEPVRAAYLCHSQRAGDQPPNSTNTTAASSSYAHPIPSCCSVPKLPESKNDSYYCCPFSSSECSSRKARSKLRSGCRSRSKSGISTTDQDLEPKLLTSSRSNNNMNNSLLDGNQARSASLSKESIDCRHSLSQLNPSPQ